MRLLYSTIVTILLALHPALLGPPPELHLQGVGGQAGVGGSAGFGGGTTAPPPTCSSTYVGSHCTNAASTTYSCTAGNLIHLGFWSDHTPGGATPTSSPAATWNVIAVNLPSGGASPPPNLAAYDWWGICPTTGSVTFNANPANPGGDQATSVAEYATSCNALDAGQANAWVAPATVTVSFSMTGLAGSMDLGLALTNDSSGTGGSTSTTGWTERVHSGSCFNNSWDNLNLGTSSPSFTVTQASGAVTGVMGAIK